MYVVEEKPTIVSGSPLPREKTRYKLEGKVMTSEGEEANLKGKDKEAVKALVKTIETKLNGMTETQKDEYIDYVNTKF